MRESGPFLLERRERQRKRERVIVEYYLLCYPTYIETTDDKEDKYQDSLTGLGNHSLASNGGKNELMGHLSS